MRTEGSAEWTSSRVLGEFPEASECLSTESIPDDGCLEAAESVATDTGRLLKSRVLESRVMSDA